ncbi:MAG: AMP-binding protein, partial [bacterium]|nr:AMP-binding protein [bacterium]
RQLERGEEISLPAKTTSFKRWSERLQEYARSETPAAELGYWLAGGRKRVARLPQDTSGGRNTVDSTRTVAVTLGAEETRALLQDVPAAYRTGINDVLLAAVAWGLADCLGEKAIRIDLEGHGREEVFEGTDLSRTVGWFTSLYPVVLEIAEARDPGEVLKSVKEQLRSVPVGGLGYGVLRYLSEQGEVEALRSLPAAELLFNYLGQLDDTSAESSLLRPAAESSGLAMPPGASRSHLVGVTGSISGGRLQLLWVYSENVHHRATIEGWVRGFRTALGSLIRHCLSPEAGGYTPSDFPLAGLDQARLDAWLAGARQVEDLYPLSPLQHGILFHTLYEPRSGEYFQQVSWDMEGELDVGAFRRAWQWAVDRHAILRTAFFWEGLDQPLQKVQRAAALPWAQQDWCGRSPEELEQGIEALLRADRSRGFELSEAPLARVTLIRTGEKAYRSLFSFHHLLFDGWSVGRLLQEIFSCYEASCRGRAPDLGSPRPYRDYIALLAQRDLAAAEAFWRRGLAGFTTPTVLSAEHGPQSVAEAPDYREHGIPVPATLSAALQSMAAGHGMTVNTLVQGAWALLMARYSGRDDVLFGTTTSGRPAELPGVESMVGLFINTLPVRVRISPQEAVPAWLERLQVQQAELRHYEYSPLDQVHRWSEVPADRALFDYLLVFENYPIDVFLSQAVEGLTIRDVRSFERTHYALTAVVISTPELMLRMLYECRFWDTVTVLRMLGHFENLLRGMSTEPSAGSGPRRLGELPMLAEGERQQLLVEWNDTAAPYPRESTIHELFEAQAARTPEAVAVVLGEEQVSYRELNRRANHLAHHLRACGVGRSAGGSEVCVGLCVERSLEMVVGILGILKAGGAYVPLDPSYPAERLAFMLEDVAAPVVLVQAPLRERLSLTSSTPALRLVDLDGEAALLRSYPSENPVSGATAENLAYVMYTSGSTGVPKGVSVPHRGVVRLVRGANYAAFGSREVFLQLAPISFDASTLEIWAPLLNGGRLVVFPAGTPSLQ